MKRRYTHSPLVAVLIGMLVFVSTASADNLGEILFGRKPGLKDRLNPDGKYDLTCRDPRTGIPEVYAIGQGEKVPYDLSFTVEQGLIVVLQPLADTGERGAGNLTFRRSLELLAEIKFDKNPRKPPKVESDAAHLIAPPGWELTGDGKLKRCNRDANEEEWVKETTRKVAREGWKIAITAGLPSYIFVNSKLLPQGGSTFQFVFSQDGRNPLHGGDSIAFSIFRARGAESGAEYDMDGNPYNGVQRYDPVMDAPRGVPCFARTPEDTPPNSDGNSGGSYADVDGQANGSDGGRSSRESVEENRRRADELARREHEAREDADRQRVADEQVRRNREAREAEAARQQAQEQTQRDAENARRGPAAGCPNVSSETLKYLTLLASPWDGTEEGGKKQAFACGRTGDGLLRAFTWRTDLSRMGKQIPQPIVWFPLDESGNLITTMPNFQWEFGRSKEALLEMKDGLDGAGRPEWIDGVYVVIANPGEVIRPMVEGQIVAEITVEPNTGYWIPVVRGADGRWQVVQ